MLDVLFINPANHAQVYQGLADEYSAVEPPTWSLLLAQSCRSIGLKVSIVDANAENLSDEEVLSRIKKLNPKIICLVVYGQNVNAGTANMRGAIDITNFLKEEKILKNELNNLRNINIFKLNKNTSNNFILKIKLNSIITKKNDEINFDIDVNNLFSKKFNLRNIKDLKDSSISINVDKKLIENTILLGTKTLKNEKLITCSSSILGSQKN